MSTQPLQISNYNSHVGGVQGLFVVASGEQSSQRAQLIHCSNRERGLALIPFGEPLDFRDPILKCLHKAQLQASVFSIWYQVI